jgi:hypothetical protein
MQYLGYILIGMLPALALAAVLIGAGFLVEKRSKRKRSIKAYER